MVVGSRALGYMGLGRLEEGERPWSLGGQPCGGGWRRSGSGGRRIAHHEPSHPHVRAVGRQAERKKTQERPEVHVSGAGQLGRGDRWTPGQQVGITASTHPFT